MILNRITKRAFAVLSGEWQRLPDLCKLAGPEFVGEWGFIDLLEAGHAERRIDTLKMRGIETGCAIYYRRKE